MQTLLFQRAEKIVEVLQGIDRHEAIDALDVARIMLRLRQTSRLIPESQESAEAVSSIPGIGHPS